LAADLEVARVHVWMHRLDVDPSRLPAFETVLSEDERERAARYRFAVDRQRFVVSRGALRHLLGRYLERSPRGLVFQYHCACHHPQCSPNRRKPTLSPDSGHDRLRFNLSHSREIAVFAVSAVDEVGIDVEYMRPDVDWRALARETLSADDADRISRLADDAGVDAFYRCWTRKEALLKSMGRGLTHLTEVQPSLLNEGRADALPGPWTFEGRTYAFTSLRDVPAGYAASLVTRGFELPAPVSAWSWSLPVAGSDDRQPRREPARS
jgi:4'-phosphopantetheinyl transferase